MEMRWRIGSYWGTICSLKSGRPRLVVDFWQAKLPLRASATIQEEEAEVVQRFWRGPAANSTRWTIYTTKPRAGCSFWEGSGLLTCAGSGWRCFPVQRCQYTSPCCGLHVTSVQLMPNSQINTSEMPSSITGLTQNPLVARQIIMNSSSHALFSHWLILPNSAKKH